MILTNLNNCLTIINYLLFGVTCSCTCILERKLFKANLAINIFSLYFASFTIIIRFPMASAHNKPFFLSYFVCYRVQVFIVQKLFKEWCSNVRSRVISMHFKMLKL